MLNRNWENGTYTKELQSYRIWVFYTDKLLKLQCSVGHTGALVWLIILKDNLVWGNIALIKSQSKHIYQISLTQFLPVTVKSLINHSAHGFTQLWFLWFKSLYFPNGNSQWGSKFSELGNKLSVQILWWNYTMKNCQKQTNTQIKNMKGWNIEGRVTNS